MIRARQAHLAECAVLGDFTAPPPGVDLQLHQLALYLKADLVELYSIELDEFVLTRWFLWLLEVELKSYVTSAPVAKLYRRRLTGDEPTKEEWAAAEAEAAVSVARAAGAGAAGAAETAEGAMETARDRMRTALFVCARGDYL